MVTFPRFTPMERDWYYGYNCQTCGMKVPVTLDPDDGEGNPAAFEGWIVIACNHGHEHRYRGSEMLRIECK
jgi:hypothetical protein